MTQVPLPLAGYRVLDYSQFVAGPLATMLLADLGADVIKVESPSGDAYRHYETLGGGNSRRFMALNRNKRSVVCDLKSAGGRELSRELIATADAVVHNMPPDRAVAFGLDRESIRDTNPFAVVVAVSAFGSQGPRSDRLGYDLIAQAYTGMLMTDARAEDLVPRRSGGIPYSDITAGLLACISVTSGLAERPRGGGRQFEVSLLGAALATQIQNFVRIEADQVLDPRRSEHVSRPDLTEVAATIADADELEPYYRCYEACDGYFALACLTSAQRRRVLAMLDVSDQWVDNPQRVPESSAERAERAALARRFAAGFRQRPAAYWISRLSQAGVPSGEVHLVEQLFDDEQVCTNGLAQRVHQPGAGQVALLGSVFKIDGVVAPSPAPSSGLGEHTDELVAELALSAVEGDSGHPEMPADNEQGVTRAS